MSLVMPCANPVIVLPWRTRATTHAALVHELEERLGTAWAEIPIAPCRWSRENKASFRYGNHLLGARGSLPEHPDIPSYSHFLKTWRREASLENIVVRKWMPFAKCTQCAVFRELEASHFKRDKKVRAEAYRTHKLHLEDMKLERLHYYSNRLRGELDPDVYLSLIIDGADQSGHQLPHFCNRSHVTDEAVKQQLYAYGAIAHGRKALHLPTPGACPPGPRCDNRGHLAGSE